MSHHGAVHVSFSPPLGLDGWSSCEAGRLGERQSEPWSGTSPDYAHQDSGDDDGAVSWEEYHPPQPSGTKTWVESVSECVWFNQRKNTRSRNYKRELDTDYW